MSTIIFAVIVYIFSADELIIRSEVNWEEIERVLKLSDISELRLYIEYNSEIVPHIKELSQLVRYNVSMSKLTLNDRGYCDYVKFSSYKIYMRNVSLSPASTQEM